MADNKFPTRPRESAAPTSLAKLIGKLVIVLGLMLAGYLGSRSGIEFGTPAENPTAKAPDAQATETKQVESRQQVTREAETPAPARPEVSPVQPKPSTTIDNVVIRDESRRVVYRGAVDLEPTIERIDSGRRLKFANDGSVFQNRERRLPKQVSGYYREWVHPTPKLSGPGPQRVVTGKEGEVYYTPDHYQSFQRIK